MGDACKNQLCTARRSPAAQYMIGEGMINNLVFDFAGDKKRLRGRGKQPKSLTKAQRLKAIFGINGRYPRMPQYWNKKGNRPLSAAADAGSTPDNDDEDSYYVSDHTTGEERKVHDII